MSFLKKLFSRRDDTESYAFREKRARELHGKSVRYVTENRGGNEDVVGRGGAMAVKDGKFYIDSGGDRLFVCNIETLEASYLMSGDGVIVKGKDLLNGEKERTVTVHFVYYRK